MNNTDRIKYNKNDHFQTFVSSFSSDTWKDNYGEIHSNDTLVESSVYDWKKSFLIKKHGYPLNNEIRNWQISHKEHHMQIVNVRGTFEDAIDYLLNNRSYNNGWIPLDMGRISITEFVNITLPPKLQSFRKAIIDKANWYIGEIMEINVTKGDVTFTFTIYQDNGEFRIAISDELSQDIYPLSDIHEAYINTIMPKISQGEFKILPGTQNKFIRNVGS